MSLNFKNYLSDILIIESIENEEFDFEKISELKSFSARIKYVQSRFPKIGMGSSRVVFDIGDGKVLKLARNEKGKAQNEAESDYYLTSSPYIPDVFEHDDENYLWIISEKASKITKKEFEKLTGISFEKFVNGINTQYKKINGKQFFGKELSKEEMDELWEIDFCRDMFDLIGSFDLLPGDMGRINSWGKIKDKAVLVDAGFTQSVHKQHYYKESVDENIADQREFRANLIRKQFGLSDNTNWIHVYHGTLMRNINSINQNGFRNGTWFAIDEQTANRFGQAVVASPRTKRHIIDTFVYIGSLLPSGDKYLVSAEKLYPNAKGFVPKDLILKANEIE